MTSPVDELLEKGYDADAAVSRVVLLERASAALTAMAGPPVWRWVVPGRVELFGKHTDYAGGRSLVAALPRGFAVAARPRTDDVVRVMDARNVETLVVDGTAATRFRRGWGAYVAAVVQRLSENFPGATLGADVAFVSDLPRAAGVSSSSALLTAMAMVLVRRGALDERPEFQAAIGSAYDRAAYFACIENGQSFRTLHGASGVGTEGGSEDHTAILCSRPRTVSLFRYAPIVLERTVTFPAAWRLVVMSSGVHADKAGTVRERYNRASRLAGGLLAIWNARASAPAPSLRAALASDPDAAGWLRTWIREAGDLVPAGWAVEDLVRRLDHFLKEDARAPLAAAAIAAADLVQLGVLAAESQAEAEHLLGNQVPETITLVRCALESGAPAASSFGAGFGGSAWGVVPADLVHEVSAAWSRTYRELYPQLTKIEQFTAIPSPPALELS